MTLKEDIQNIIYMDTGKEKVGITWIETKRLTDKILTQISKKIDEREKLIFGSLDNAERGLYLLALDWMRKELSS